MSWAFRGGMARQGGESLPWVDDFVRPPNTVSFLTF